MNSNPPQSNEVPTPDIESLVCEDIKARQEKGIKKYGMTVAMNPATLKEKLQHGYEEGLDRAIYDKWAILHVEQLQRELAEANESIALIKAGTEDRLQELGRLLNIIKKQESQLATLTTPIEPEELRKALDEAREVVESPVHEGDKAWPSVYSTISKDSLQTIILYVRQGQSINPNRYLQSLNINQNFPKE